jgi:hypothetical protein
MGLHDMSCHDKSGVKIPLEILYKSKNYDFFFLCIAAFF